MVTGDETIHSGLQLSLYVSQRFSPYLIVGRL